jgi:hypothetical protein
MSATLRHHLPGLFVAAAVAAAFGLQGCTAVELDPFRRPYGGENMMKPGMAICDRVEKGTQRPRIIRGNQPRFPLEA